MDRIGAVLAGPAFDIEVPAGGVVNSATLTLPYSETRLHVPEGDVRIWTYHEDRQLWLPVPGTQSIDSETNTVTAQVTHFSVYAVLGINDTWGWEQVFDQIPLRCTVGGGSTTGFDIGFVIDISGSMGWNDPSGYRVDGAKAFVDEMGTSDRAGVVTFESFASTVLGLTSTSTPENVTTIKNALEAGRAIRGGTSITAAVAEAIELLGGTTSEPRVRAAILLTDGDSSYNHTYTQLATEAGIEIHTVGLGADVNASLLQSIADGTGGTYRSISDPAQLPELYQELAGDIIGGGDSEPDGIEDCVERNGAFTPLLGLFAFEPRPADFITSDPSKADTDGDGLADGEELIETPLADDPELVEGYGFLVDQGLDSYYRMVADPNEPDSDGDGVDDGIEVFNGTDPLSFDDNELGIDGLARFTLFQPSRYDGSPEVPMRLLLEEGDDGWSVAAVRYNDDPVAYDADRDCVRNCEEIEDLAEARPNDGGWLPCVFGRLDCVDDVDQMRDIVEEARVAQGVFDSSGYLSVWFLRQQAAALCALWSDDADACVGEAIDLDFRDHVNPEDLDDELAAGVAALPIPGLVPGVGVNPARVRAVAEALRAAGIATASVAVVQDVLQGCYGSKIMQVLEAVDQFRHVCEFMPIFSPGGEENLIEFTRHNAAAIAARPDRGVLIYATEAENRARGVSHNWKDSHDPCNDPAKRTAASAEFRGVAVHCDEMPYYSTSSAGPGASLRYIPRTHNLSGGGRLGTFHNEVCPPTKGLPMGRTGRGQTPGPVTERVPYLVIPRVGGEMTSWCTRG